MIQEMLAEKAKNNRAMVQVYREGLLLSEEGRRRLEGACS
jgi:hypothetical protein